MFDYAPPVLYALFLWWFSTGLILLLDGLPRRTFRWSLLGASAAFGLALHGIASSAGDPTPAGAYAAFTSAVLVWGWNEIAFLMGFVTGPRTEACPVGCRGWRHFGHAIATVLHHELALAASGLLVVLLTWGAANQVATWTFLILWAMRLSAKLNLFLGVPNPSAELLPEHLAYLQRYLTRKRMNALFPLSVTLSTAAAALLVQGALAPPAGSFPATGRSLLATLAILGVVEHWFLLLPLPARRLWRWSLRSRAERRADRALAVPRECPES